jgi:hypothetical protein
MDLSCDRTGCFHILWLGWYLLDDQAALMPHDLMNRYALCLVLAELKFKYKFFTQLVLPAVHRSQQSLHEAELFMYLLYTCIVNPCMSDSTRGLNLGANVQFNFNYPCVLCLWSGSETTLKLSLMEGFCYTCTCMFAYPRSSWSFKSFIVRGGSRVWHVCRKRPGHFTLKFMVNLNQKCFPSMKISGSISKIFY